MKLIQAEHIKNEKDLEQFKAKYPLHPLSDLFDKYDAEEFENCVIVPYDSNSRMYEVDANELLLKGVTQAFECPIASCVGEVLNTRKEVPCFEVDGSVYIWVSNDLIEWEYV